MGTGPSLAAALEKYLRLLQEETTIAVNTFCLDAAYEAVKPDFYAFSDPVYSRADCGERAANKRYRVLRALKEQTRWPLHALFALYPGQVDLTSEFKHTSISHHLVNIFPPFEVPWIRNYAYSTGFVQPLVKNVVGFAIMAAINMGFREIYVIGADHSLHREFYVGDDNHIYGRWKHFDGTSGEQPMRKGHAADAPFYRVHEVWRGMWRTFRSYHLIAEYARFRGVQVLNATPGSFIDAFDRCSLSDL